jgi:hypothetical protein
MVAMVDLSLVVVVAAKHQPVAMGHLPLAVMAVLVSLFHGQDPRLDTQAAAAVAVKQLAVLQLMVVATVAGMLRVHLELTVEAVAVAVAVVTAVGRTTVEMVETVW